MRCTVKSWTRVLLMGLALAAMATSAAAQHYSFDARSIALGGVGDARNVASGLVEQQRRYETVVLPFGLFQILGNLDVFDPDRDSFDPVRAMEYVASPIHYTWGRDQGGSGRALVNDIVNARLGLDLNAYRGFKPATELVSEGLGSSSWGKTFVVYEAQQTLQGVYVGVGPYASVQTRTRIDPELANLLGSPVDLYVPDKTFGIGNATTSQLALAITGGYRARLPLAWRTGAGSNRDGIYVAANYHHLYGFRLDDFGLDVRFDTDADGLLTLLPTTTPVAVERLRSSTGRGFAIDAGVAVVIDRWNVGAGVTGVANRMVWKRLTRRQLVLESLFDGGAFVDVEQAGPETHRVELPLSYAGDVGYHADRWSAVVECAQGFQGANVRGGVEYRWRWTELRAGGRYARDRWHPSAGVGFNFTPRFGIDVAVFGSSTNIERRRQTAVAVSLRMGRE